MIKLQDIMSEAPYVGNMGFEEMMKFYDVASDKEIKQVEKMIDRGKEREAWKLIQKVTGMKLKGKDFN